MRTAILPAKEKAGRSPPLNAPNKLRSFATRWRFLRNDIFRVLHLSQDRLGVILELMRVRRLIDEMLEKISRFLVLGLVASAEERQSRAQVCIGVIGLGTGNTLVEVDKQTVDVRLTEGYMMDPEASVSAIVIHHPDAKYFSLSPADIERLERELDTPSKEAAAG